MIGPRVETALGISAQYTWLLCSMPVTVVICIRHDGNDSLKTINDSRKKLSVSREFFMSIPRQLAPIIL